MRIRAAHRVAQRWAHRGAGMHTQRRFVCVRAPKAAHRRDEPHTNKLARLIAVRSRARCRPQRRQQAGRNKTKQDKKSRARRLELEPNPDGWGQSGSIRARSAGRRWAAPDNRNQSHMEASGRLARPPRAVLRPRSHDPRYKDNYTTRAHYVGRRLIQLREPARVRTQTSA